MTPGWLSGRSPSRRSTTVRKVLLDRGFVVALVDTDHPQHGASKALYAELVERYVERSDRLFALSSVLADVPREFRRTALAPVESINVSWQHRHAARGVVNAVGSTDVALSLVVLRRERLSAIATTSADYDGIEIAVLSVAPAPVEAMPAGYVSYETAPLPARRSTDG